MRYRLRVLALLVIVAAGYPATVGAIRFFQERIEKAREQARIEAFREIGREEARRDIADGKFKVRSAGRPLPWRGDYHEAIQRRYGIEVDVTGCMVPAGYCETSEGYHEVMNAEIERRFGKGVLDQVDDEVREEFVKSHPEWGAFSKNR